MRHKILMMLALVSILIAASTAGTSLSTAPTAATSAHAGTLVPQAGEVRVDEAIAYILTHYHYEKRPLDDALSQQILDHYLSDLDPNRSYFLQSDIDSFGTYRNALDDAIRNGNLNPAFNIYNVYQKRVEQRIQYAIHLLDKEPDFTVKETYTFDRTKLPWMQTTVDLDDLWRKRVKNDAIGLLLAGKTWSQTADILRKRYQNFEYRTRQVNDEDVFNVFMNAYTRSLDPHTDYFSPDQSQEFQIQMSLKLQGIGAALISDGEYTRVDRILPGGPAARSKDLHPDDRITGVAQGEHGDMVDVVGWRLDDVVALIRGNPGTTVRLQILPAGAAPGSPEKILQLVRDTVKLEAQAAHQHVETVTRGSRTYRIGVITIPTFYSDFQGRQAGDKDYTSTTRDVRRLLDQLKAQHVDGVVIDLRNNGGGSLQEAKDLTGLFVPTGPVVQIRDPDGKVDVEDSEDDSGVVYTGPLAVLVNRFTASASEIFAGAIQDYRRGIIIGSTTYGKGTVQTLVDLDRFVPGNDDAGQLKLTIDKFYRVTGSSTQTKGVTPDIALPSPVDSAEFGEASQDSALPWDEIGPADYSPLSTGLQHSLPTLKNLHDSRAAKDPGWHLYLDAVHDAETLRDETSVSLVLADRKKEREQHDQQRLAQANAWRKLKNLPPAATLEDAYKLPPATPAAGAASASSADASDSNPDDADNLEPDVLLDESVQVVTDMAFLGIPDTSALAKSN